MSTSEPAATALLLTTCGVLLAASVLFSRVSQRAGVPLALLFIVVGMLAGSEGIGGIVFSDYPFAFRIGAIALALILFDGGLNTPMEAVRRYWAPAGVLATVGVVLTAGLVAVAAHAMGLDWPEAMILGAVVSSTDAAAVFSILRGSGLHLKRRVGVTLELESGLNDPVAVILTTSLTANLLSADAVDGWGVTIEILIQLVVGGVVGVAIATAGRALLARIGLVSGGLYPPLTLAVAFLAFGLATLLHGSGFLAVYLAGLLLGNSPLPYKAGLLRVHDALAWLSQIGMFLILGLLVFPSRLPEVAGIGLAIALLLAVVRAADHGGALPAPVPLSGEGGRLRRLGRPPGRGPHRARHLPGARAGAGRRPDLPPGVLPGGGERVHPGRHGGVGDAAARARGRGAARAAGSAGDRVAPAAPRRAPFLLHRRRAGGGGATAGGPGFPRERRGSADRQGRPAHRAQGRHGAAGGRPRVSDRPGGGQAVCAADVWETGGGIGLSAIGYQLSAKL